MRTDNNNVAAATVGSRCVEVGQQTNEIGGSEEGRDINCVFKDEVKFLSFFSSVHLSSRFISLFHLR